jgi:drug/metabolite transporter (DMT)-like permease
VQVSFAVFPALGKIALREIPAEGLVAWRSLTGAVFFLTLARFREGSFVHVPKGRFADVLVLSLLGVTLNQMMFVKGLSLSSAIKGGLMVATIPALTYIVAVLAKAERVTATRVFGLLLATAGTAQLLLVGMDGNLVRLLPEDVLYLGNATVYAVYLVRVRRYLVDHSPLVVLGWIFGLSVPLLLPFGAASMFAARSATAWWALAGILLFPTILAYLGNAVALLRVRSSVAGIYVALQPFVSASLAWVFLGESLHWREVLMGVLAGLGLIFVSRPGRSVPADSKEGGGGAEKSEGPHRSPRGSSGHT